MDEFGWTESEAVFKFGLAMAGGGVLAVFAYAAVPHLAKR